MIDKHVNDFTGYNNNINFCKIMHIYIYLFDTCESILNINEINSNLI